MDEHLGNLQAPGGAYLVAGKQALDLRWHYVIKGLFRRGETSLLFGPSNSGKSALIVSAGAAIIGGRDFFGLRTRRGIVIHVVAEAPRSILERYAALQDEIGEDPAPYLVGTKPLDLGDPESVAAFITKVRKIAADANETIALVVFDTLVLCIGGRDENHSGEMTQVTRGAHEIARALFCHVCLVHHTGKEGANYRGSSAFRANLDAEISLTPAEGQVTMRVTKQRNMPTGLERQFRTEPVLLGQDGDGEDRTTVRIRPVASAAATLRAPESADPGKMAPAILAVLKALASVGSDPAGTVGIAAIDACLPESLFGALKPESRRRSLARALERLERQVPPVVQREGAGWRLAVSEAANAEAAPQSRLGD